MEPVELLASGRPRATWGRRATAAALTLVTLGFLLSTSAWIRRDAAPPLWDTALYLQQSTILYRTLSREGTLAFFESFSHSMGQRAPLIAALPIPFYASFGESHTAARCVNLVWMLLASVYLFRIGRWVGGDAVGLFATIVLNTFPLVAGMSRHYLVEYGLMTLVILWIYYLMRWLRRGAQTVPWILGLLLGLGLLLKVTMPFYVAAPTFLVLWQRSTPGRRSRQFVTDLARILIVAVPIAALWYAHNLGEVSRFLLSGGFGDAGRPYGTGPVFSMSAIARYWLNLVNGGVSFFYFAALLTVFVGYCAAAWRRPANWSALLAHRDAHLLLAWCLPPWFALTFAVNKEVRLVVPYLPALAVMLGAGIARIAPPVRRDTALALIAGLGLLNYAYYSFTPSRFKTESRLGEFVLVSSNLGWAHPPSAQPWPCEEVVRIVADDAEAHAIQKARVRVLFSHPGLNAHVLNYLATLHERTPRFSTVHFQSPETLPALIEEINSTYDYVLTKSGAAGPPMLNTRNLEVAAALQRGDLQFAPIGALLLPDGSAVTLRRRIALAR